MSMLQYYFLNQKAHEITIKKKKKSLMVDHAYTAFLCFRFCDLNFALIFVYKYDVRDFQKFQNVKSLGLVLVSVRIETKVSDCQVSQIYIQLVFVSHFSNFVVTLYVNVTSRKYVP